MIVKPNQTAIDVAFDLCGSLAGFPTLLGQLPTGARVGFDNYPLLLDVSDIGQTWTPTLEGVEVDFTLKVYKATALSKAPYSTHIGGLADAIAWGQALLPSLFDYTGYVEYEYLEDVIPDSLKHKVVVNQTIVDVTFDLSGSLTGIVDILSQLPDGDRIGFDELPEVWEDTNTVGQTWTPDLQQKSFKLDVPVYNLLSIKKGRYSTDILKLLGAITWGNEFLAGVITSGDFLVDNYADFLTDDYDNYITT